MSEGGRIWTVVRAVFRTPWSSLTVDDVEAFLADAGDEGLLWEAKGPLDINAAAIRKAACGFANSEGGFLILGAARDRATKKWSLRGAEFPGGEATAWIDQVIRDNGVRPLPHFDIRSWDKDGGQVAVVMVERVVTPPCITRDGQVFLRTSGRTPPVTDPAVLLELTTRGRAAHGRARSLAEQAADRWPIEHRSKAPTIAADWPESSFAVGLAAVAYENDVARCIFSRRFEDQMGEIVLRRLWPYSEVARQFRLPPLPPAHEQDAVIATLTLPGGLHDPDERRWIVRVEWSGAVSVELHMDTDTSIEDAFHQAFPAAWATAVEVVQAVGGYGAACFALMARSRAGRSWHFPVSHMPIERDVELRESSDEEVADVKRELLRATGRRAHEPDPPPES